MNRLELESLVEMLPSNGWLTVNEAELLLRAAETTTGTILEVGVYHGRSTIVLGTLNRPLICVDPFEGFSTTDVTGEIAYKSFLENTEHIENLHLLKIKIEDFTPKQLEFAYLDGDHTYQGTMEQIAVAKKCGVLSMCLHDYADSGGGIQIKKAVRNSDLRVLARVGVMVHCAVI